MSISILIIAFNLMAIMNKNIISMWFFMEMGTLLFIYSLIKMKNPPKSAFIYFLVSVISSILIIYEISISSESHENFSMMNSKNVENNFLTTLAFLIKMSVIPFQSWLYKMTENMKWISILILMSIMKIIPIWYLSLFSNIKLMVMTLLINLTMFVWIPMKSNNSFFMISTSSISNNLWIILCSINSLVTTMLFSISYFLINSNFILMLKKNNSKIKSEENSKIMVISTLSLMGFPPLPMFFMKIMAIKNTFMMQSGLIFISIMMMISNLMLSIMYMKFSLSPMMLTKKSKDWKSMSSENKTLILSSQMSYLLYFLSISIK